MCLTVQYISLRCSVAMYLSRSVFKSDFSKCFSTLFLASNEYTLVMCVCVASIGTVIEPERTTSGTKTLKKLVGDGGGHWDGRDSIKLLF